MRLDFLFAEPITYELTKDGKKLRRMELFPILVILWGKIPPFLK
jgi:hypothetical protein